MLKIKQKIFGVKIFYNNDFKDFRGRYFESFNVKEFRKFSKTKFVQDDFSSSKRSVLRGFHGDGGTSKLFYCVKGKIQFAFINYDKKSKYYLKNYSLILSENDRIQVLLPPKYGAAHLVLSKDAILHYKQSTYYGEYTQFTVSYKSPILNFKWKLKKVKVSKRDSQGLIIE